MANTIHSNANKHGGHSHVQSVPLLLGNMIVLMVLLLITYAASKWDAGNVTINNVIALVIATVKAVLVIWVFMGVMHSTKLTRMWVACGFVVLILLFGILGDYSTRKFEPVAGWEANRPNGGESSLQRTWPPEGKTEQVGTNFRPRG
jgi:cytochrome c oxidase subunit 4